MKAWLLDDLKGISQLRLSDVPEPIAQAGEAVVELRFAALNPADRYLAEGQYPARPGLPHVLGRDGIGRVIQIGAGVSDIQIGERRSILRGEVGVGRAGTFAQRVSVPVQNLVEAPSDWSEREAAGATLVYLTAYQALTMWGPLSPEALVLVTGASGGVGVAAVQLGSAMGLTVIALSRSAEKGARLCALGAAATFDPQQLEWQQALKARFAPRRVELVIDNIGGTLLPQAIELLGELGKASLVGRLAGPVPNFNTATLFFRRLRLGGVAVGAYTNAQSRAAWQQVVQLLTAKGSRPQIDSVFPFEQLPKAFERLAQGPLGKVLLEITL